ncbi:MAG: amidohydrolase family protein [Isosphaeraceae bacterium]|nr:amidohydrolase family protein [Isosphaeraceae bacterium]
MFRVQLNRSIATAAALAMIASTALAEPIDPPAHPPRLIRGGTVIDGTGSPGIRADVLVENGRIRAVGPEIEAPAGAVVVDASGLIVCPGFIDLHSHSDGPIVAEATRSNLNFQRQGVTTIVTGNCGSGALDVAAYFEAIDSRGAGTNVIQLIPHNVVRARVVGREDRAPTDAELERMREVVETQMKAGAWGMSTGLIYQPGVFSKTPELVELAKVVARRGGLYASHIRNEGSELIEAIDEAITIGREARLPVHISHLKASGKSNWGKAAAACERIEAARARGEVVTADQYPYVASSTRLTAMIVPAWAAQGTTADFVRRLDDPETGPKLRREIERGLAARDGGASIRIARYSEKPGYAGKSLADIARAERRPVLEVALEIERRGSAQAISFGMSEDDVRLIMKRGFVATASDGSSHRPGGGDRPHPRSYGTFPRKVRYAIDEGVISLEGAIRANSGLPAEILGLADRGKVAPGRHADLLVFDPKTFRDRATFDDPTVYATGVRLLLVNGVAVIENDEPKRVLPGRALRLDRDGPASVVMHCGRIWTGDSARPWAESVAIRAGAIAAVGSKAEIEAFRGPKTLVIERPKAFALPGLIDAHVHLGSLGEGLEEIELRDVASLEKVAELVRKRIEAEADGGWILGSHWDQSLWPGGEFPTKAVLDAAAPNRPVWLRRVDGHAGWANTEAMRRAGITRDSQAPSDGRIIRDAAGEPTGIFIDGAMGLVTRAIPNATPAQLERRILAAQDESIRHGLTSVHDAGISTQEAEIFRRLDREGKLKLRVYGMVGPAAGREVEEASRPYVAPGPNDRFELNAVKLFADGAMGSRGGLLFEPYADDPHHSGLALIDAKTLEQAALAGLKSGRQICTHAIGDKGNAMVLDAYAAAIAAAGRPAREPRLRIEHAQVVRKADVARFASLGVIASMQPSHSSDDMRWADARLGPERVAGAYAWRWFLDARVRLAFGSDFPVAIVDPFYGIYCALTRQDLAGKPEGGWHPDQRMTIEETLRAFTAGSAHAAYAEDRIGTLRPGMRADLTIVDRDLFRTPPAEIARTRVLFTVIDGEIVYSAR